jgi:hypothetical protein
MWVLCVYIIIVIFVFVTLYFYALRVRHDKYIKLGDKFINDKENVKNKAKLEEKLYKKIENNYDNILKEIEDLKDEGIIIKEFCGNKIYPIKIYNKYSRYCNNLPSLRKICRSMDRQILTFYVTKEPCIEDKIICKGIRKYEYTIKDNIIIHVYMFKQLKFPFSYINTSLHSFVKNTKSLRKIKEQI